MPLRHASRVLDEKRLLDTLGSTRRELIFAAEAMPRGSARRAVAEVLTKNIDDLAHLLTGDRRHFHAPLHSAAPHMPNRGKPAE